MEQDARPCVKAFMMEIMEETSGNMGFKGRNPGPKELRSSWYKCLLGDEKALSWRKLVVT